MFITRLNPTMGEFDPSGRALQDTVGHVPTSPCAIASTSVSTDVVPGALSWCVQRRSQGACDAHSHNEQVWGALVCISILIGDLATIDGSFLHRRPGPGQTHRLTRSKSTVLPGRSLKAEGAANCGALFGPIWCLPAKRNAIIFCPRFDIFVQTARPTNLPDSGPIYCISNAVYAH